MKKIFAFLVTVLVVLSAKADVTTGNDRVYIGDLVIQKGTTSASLDVYCVADTKDLGAVSVVLDLPEGVTLDGEEKEDFGPTCYAVNLNYYPNCPYLSFANSTKAGKESKVVSIPIKISDAIAVGNYEITLLEWAATFADGSSQYDSQASSISTFKVQKTAVIEPQSDDVQFDILPEIVSEGAVDLKVLLKNKLDVANFTLTVTYPEGVTPKSGRGSAPTVITDNLYSSTDGSVKALSIGNSVNGQVATYTVSNTALDTYMAKNEYYTAFTLPVTISGADALYNITAEISNIVAYDAANDANLENPISIPGGGFATSLFLGTPAETDPILYGHYTKDIINTLNDGVAKNFCTIDMSAATVDEGCKVNDALVYTADKTTYDRSIKTTYGTVCLPIEATTTGKFYTLTEVTKDVLTFTEGTAQLDANTPALFTGVVSASATGTVTPDATKITDSKLKGTYETFNLPENAGYYISGDKFYCDGAKVKAFRAYVDGVVSAKALRIQIEDATGIHDITDQLTDQDIYNLQGIRVQTAKKGVNIINGKKVYVK